MPRDGATTEDERRIREVVDLWFAASRKGDIAAVLDLMSDDVVFMVPGHQPFGKSEFAALSAGMANVEIDGTSEIRELEVLGDLAYLRSEIEMTATPAGGTPVRRRGFTLTILRKEAGTRWRVVRDANLLTVVST